MRRIGSDKKLEKRKRNTATFISLFILAILIISTAGYAFITNSNPQQTQSNTNPQGGAIYSNGLWVVSLGSQNFYLINSPESVQNVSVEITMPLSGYSGKPLYIVSNNSAINNEIFSVVGNYASRIQRACYESCEEDLPEKDCSENMIIWKDSAEKKVYQEGNCIFIEGDLTSVDAFLYRILGISV